jgi:hypothetical protein
MAWGCPKNGSWPRAEELVLGEMALISEFWYIIVIDGIFAWDPVISWG